MIDFNKPMVIDTKYGGSEQELDRVMPSLKIVPKGAGPVEL